MEVALVYFALLALAFFFLIVRPQRRRVTQHRAFVSALELGDDVVTTGGIYGTVRALRGEAVELEVAPGIVITLARAAVAQRAYPDTARDTVQDTGTGTGSESSADDGAASSPPEIDGPGPDDDPSR
jgi:preprotein translocase subunit YajC